MAELRDEYQVRRDRCLIAIADKIQEALKQQFQGSKRIDTITARAKDTDRFVLKSEKLVEGRVRKYQYPLKEIQDQIGARVVVLYKDDIDRTAKMILDYWRHIEHQDIVPETESEFGYFGRHLILAIPNELAEGYDKSLLPDFFELQIKTLFQHAWAEANHDLGYKSETDLTSDQKRRLAYTSAQAWGADEMFSALVAELKFT